MAEPTTTSTTDAPSKPDRGGSVSTSVSTSRTAALKRWVIIVGVAALAALVAFGVGYAFGRSGQDELQRRAASADQQARLLEGRRRLDLAQVALEQRNFGIAEAHIRTAAQKLDAATEGGPQALEALARDVAQTQVGVTEDIRGQRGEIRALIARFDEHFERLQQTGTEESATPASD